MSNLYGESHRRLQQEFDSMALADRLEEMIVKSELDEQDRNFIATRDMFFLSTVDHENRPTVSYKGGDVGFVSVVDGGTIAFPSYDGNGMFYSMGNLETNPSVGLLFIDFERPNRMRLQGQASIIKNDPLLSFYSEADLVVRVKVERTWVNCPRYIHRYKKLSISSSVPGIEEKTPFAAWKRLDAVQDVLPRKDQGRPEAEGGLLTMEQYGKKVAKGET
jgi:predicted pyridoxine 5'-phosphate oxidase superfamily flavin-nucleotide-binding protein